jgi:hypothetical protein
MEGTRDARVDEGEGNGPDTTPALLQVWYARAS